MACYIIADLHLQASRPELLQAFRAFTQTLHTGDRLYILGDLFNVFVGLDPQDKAQASVRATLTQAQQRGITSFFIHGNRDFLVSAREAKKLACTLLPNNFVLAYQGLNILLTHGDDLCSNDESYQRYKRKVSNRYLQCLFRLLPLSRRRKIGNALRERSQEMVREKEGVNNLYGVVISTLGEVCQRYAQQGQALDYVVHGHIHEFGYHQDECAGLKARLVLGAWGHMLSYCSIDEQGAPQLREEPLDKWLETASDGQRP